jgi:hydroxymethylpyrimidine/phosphomethylpyrimidine kinase
MGVTPRRVMTIGGTDSSGGAGIAADLRTVAACEVHGWCAVTAVTAQNSLGVSAVHPIPAATVAAQLESVVTDIWLDVVKTGMLANVSIVEAIMAGATGSGSVGRGPYRWWSTRSQRRRAANSF